MSDNVTQNAATTDMTVTYIFDAPVTAVWKAWSEGEQVKRWWGPRGFTAPVANMAFRVGGTSLVCMRAPAEYGGQEIYNTWTYRKIVPMQEIEFINRFADSDGKQLDPATMNLPPGIPVEVRHVLIFKSLGDNRTEFTVTEYGYPSAEVAELSKSGMKECLDKLAESLQ
jgi:uncharacterized protein YndB with AHSA1/START domain